MKGRMRPYLPELTIRDYNIYLRYLRGVRRQLYEAYGLYSCHLLRSNGVLFAILSDSLAGRQATCQRKRVPGTLAWRRLMCQTQGIRLAAQVEVLLGWHNLQDRKYSELRPLKRLRRVGRRLEMEGDAVRPRLHKVLKIAFRGFNHQMGVKKHGGMRTQRPDNGSAKGEVGHKHAVHDVEVDNAAAGRVQGLEFLSQPCKIGRQHRGGNLRHGVQKLLFNRGTDAPSF